MLIRNVAELFSLLGVERTHYEQHTDTQHKFLDLVMALMFAGSRTESTDPTDRRKDLLCAVDQVHNRLMSMSQPCCIRTREYTLVYTNDDVSPCGQEWIVFNLPVDGNGMHHNYMTLGKEELAGLASNDKPVCIGTQQGSSCNILTGVCKLVPQKRRASAPLWKGGCIDKTLKRSLENEGKTENPKPKTARQSPPCNKLRYQSPPHNELRRQSPPPNELRYQSPPHNELRRQSPPPNELRYQSPPHNELRRQSPPPNELRYQSPPHNELRRQSPPPNELRYQSPPRNKLPGGRMSRNARQSSPPNQASRGPTGRPQQSAPPTQQSYPDTQHRRYYEEGLWDTESSNSVTSEEPSISSSEENIPLQPRSVSPKRGPMMPMRPHPLHRHHLHPSRGY